MGGIHRTGDDGKIYYEHQWVTELLRLIEKVGERDVLVKYKFPAGTLSAIGFQLRVRQRTISVHLCRQSPENLANGVLELALPDEETAQYHRFEDEHGEIYLSICYPYCNHNQLADVALALIEIATSPEILAHGVNRPRLQ